MIRQIISDYIHMTQGEFLMAHPLVIIGMLAVFYAVLSVIWHIRDKRAKKRKEDLLNRLKEDS